MNNCLREYDAMIFDLDGTLWNANKTYLDAWNQGIKDYNLPRVITLAEMNKMMGKEHDFVMQYFFPHLDKNQKESLSIILAKRQNQFLKKWGGRFYPDVINTIKEMSKHYQLFIVSNCDDYTLPVFIDKAELSGYFVETANYGCPKFSKSQNLQYLKEKYKLKKTVYIGDTYHDYLSATEAGMDFIQARHGFGQVIPKVKGFDSFNELMICFKIYEKPID